MTLSPNESWQPTPGLRPAVFLSQWARSDCTHRYALRQPTLMRVVSFLVLFVCARALAADPEKSQDIRPALSYPSQAAVCQWATNAFGGSQIDLYKQKEQEVLVVFRSFTSGVTTSDLSFFVPSKNHWKLALWYPVRGEGLKTQQKDDGIEVLYYDARQNRWLKRFFIGYEALFNAGA